MVGASYQQHAHQFSRSETSGVSSPTSQRRPQSQPVNSPPLQGARPDVRLSAMTASPDAHHRGAIAVIAYASFGFRRLARRGRGGRCLCGAPRGHPNSRWASTAMLTVMARVVTQRSASREEQPLSPWRVWRGRQDGADPNRPPLGGAGPASVQLCLPLGTYLDSPRAVRVTDDWRWDTLICRC